MPEDAKKRQQKANSRPARERHTAMALSLAILFCFGAFASAEEEAKPPAELKVEGTPPSTLLVADAADRRAVKYFRAVLEAKVGKTPNAKVTVATPKFLTQEPLDPFASIYLVDVRSISKKQAAALEKHVRSGGGLAVFLGRSADDEAYTKLHESGLLPAPPAGKAELKADDEKSTPDVVMLRHPIFQLYTEVAPQLRRQAEVQRYHRVKDGWKPTGETRVIAALRNRDPLVIEKPLGKGRVLLFLTSPDRGWTTWMTKPTWPIFLLDTQKYLVEGSRELRSRGS